MLKNKGDSLSNRAGGKTNNINGLITNGGGAVFTNSGTMDNDADSNFVLGDFAKLINNGVLHQHRVFNPSSRSGGIVDQKSGTLVNNGTFNQGGEGVFANLTGAKIINSGRINMFVSLLDNQGIIENTGTIEIFHFGACQNLAGSWETRPAALW